MDTTLHDAVEHMIVRYHHGYQLVLLFDYDGTLVECRARPVQAKLPQTARHDLESLADLPRVTVGVVSGRELSELERMVGLPDLFYAGTDGLELELHRSRIVHPLVQHCAPLLAEVATRLKAVIQQFPQAWLERKPFGFTLHYQDLDPAAKSALQSRVEHELSAWGDRLHAVTGAAAIEITPNLGWNKGTAIEFLLQRLAPHPCLLFAGDESSDIEALWEVGIHNGITIGVGHSSPITAQYELSDCQAVHALLKDLCLALGCGGGPAASPACRK